MPRRGTPPYWSIIYMCAESATLDDATRRLSSHWDHYGPRAVLDVMTEWVCTIDLLTPMEYRDMTGVCQPERWMRFNVNDADKVSMALRTASQRMDAQTEQEAFDKAYKITDRLFDHITQWQPIVMQALGQLAQRKDRDMVRGILARGPGVKAREFMPVRDGAAHLYVTTQPLMDMARKGGLSLRAPDFQRDLYGSNFLISSSMHHVFDEGNRYGEPTH